MAQKRMFDKSIVDSDAFLDMPLSAQALYFHLSMRADDDGFINNSKKIIRMINASPNDYTLLLVKQFIIKFEDGICVIKHWLIHNYIRPDRYKETLYQSDKNMLFLQENKAYSIIENVNNDGIPDVNQVDTQNSTDKIKLNKDNKGKGNNKRKKAKHKVKNQSKIKISEKVIEMVIDKWNSLRLTSIMNIRNTRLKLLNDRINEYGLDKVLEAIESISKSKFLQGNNDRNWTITFDWFLKASNFTKVLEGNYIDKDVTETTKEQNFIKHIPEGHDYVSLEETLLGWDK